MHAPVPRSVSSKAQQVAQELLRRIVDSKVEPGRPSPPRPTCLQRSDVSPADVARRDPRLEAQGVLEQRPGPGGGLVIRRPSLDMLAHTLSIYLRFNDVPYVTVPQAREVIEPALAPRRRSGVPTTTSAKWPSR